MGSRSFNSRNSEISWLPTAGLLAVLAGWTGTLASAASGPAAPAEPSPSLEYQIKSAFLYNFGKFVEWPSDPNEKPSSSLTLGVVGKDPFGEFLDETVQGKTLRGTKVMIRRFRQLEELEPCHILFIGSSETSRLEAILKRLEGLPVLTVGESEGFAELGGIINFVIEERKIRLQINTDAAARAGLRISSRLLDLARVVRDGDGWGTK